MPPGYYTAPKAAISALVVMVFYTCDCEPWVQHERVYSQYWNIMRFYDAWCTGWWASFGLVGHGWPEPTWYVRVPWQTHWFGYWSNGTHAHPTYWVWYNHPAPCKASMWPFSNSIILSELFNAVSDNFYSLSDDLLLHSPLTADVSHLRGCSPWRLHPPASR